MARRCKQCRDLTLHSVAEQAKKAGHDTSKWARNAAVVCNEQEVHTVVPSGGGNMTATIPVGQPTPSVAKDQDRPVPTIAGFGDDDFVHQTCETLAPKRTTGLVVSTDINPRKRRHSDETTEPESSGQSVSPTSDNGRQYPQQPRSSRADLQKYCDDKGWELDFVNVGHRRQGAQDIWTEQITVADQFRANGDGTGRKKAQAAACEALIRSGVLTDFAEYQ